MSGPFPATVQIQSVEMNDEPPRWLGYKVVMSDPSKNITCKISHEQECCEQYGAHVDAPLESFVGATYVSVTTEEQVGRVHEDMDMSVRVIVCLHTDRGTITMTLYNEHNGYYCHDFYIETEHGILQKYL